MLKFEWKELPDWADKADYDFLKDAQPHEWAWEFLRRNQQYRNDWLSIGATPKHVRVYNPPRLENEDEQAWMRRVVYKLDREPNISSLTSSFAKKWGVNELSDPFASYPSTLQFIKPSDDYPRLLLFPEDIAEYVQEDEASDGSGVLHMQGRFAVVVFDMAQSLSGIGDKTDALLRQQKKRLLAEKRIEKDAIGNEKPGNWLRHLRVLDARRSSPPVTHKTIARSLGGAALQDKTSMELSRRGTKYVDQAKRMMSRGYRHAAFYSGTSTKNAP